MAQAADNTPDRFARRREKSRAALVEAAIELFQSKSVSGTTLEEICDRADVALRTFFNHFETRQQLHEAIAQQRALGLASILDERSRDPGPFPERLRQLFASVGTYLSARPAYREFVGEMLSLPPTRGSASLRSGCLGAAMRGFVARGVEQGEVTRGHRPEVLADLILGAITTAISNWSGDHDYDLVTALDEACDVLVALSTPPG